MTTAVPSSAEKVNEGGGGLWKILKNSPYKRIFSINVDKQINNKILATHTQRIYLKEEFNCCLLSMIGWFICADIQSNRFSSWTKV